jgi:hypothetical protein
MLTNKDDDKLDGSTAKQIFESHSCFAYTYDDLILLPGFVNSAVNEVSLDTHITRKIKLHLPLLRYETLLVTSCEDNMMI